MFSQDKQKETYWKCLVLYHSISITDIKFQKYQQAREKFTAILIFHKSMFYPMQSIRPYWQRHYSDCWNLVEHGFSQDSRKYLSLNTVSNLRICTLFATKYTDGWFFLLKCNMYQETDQGPTVVHEEIFISNWSIKLLKWPIETSLVKIKKLLSLSFDNFRHSNWIENLKSAER